MTWIATLLEIFCEGYSEYEHNNEYFTYLQYVFVPGQTFRHVRSNGSHFSQVRLKLEYDPHFHVTPWCRHQMKTLSALPGYWPFVRGIHRSPMNSPLKGQWRGALMCFDTRLNKRLSKQSGGLGFKTPSRPSWRHCNAISSCVSAAQKYLHLQTYQQQTYKDREHMHLKWNTEI